jgi:hypothetical protein
MNRTKPRIENVFRPFRAEPLSYGLFLGLKPHAQAYHPFGVQTEHGRSCKGQDRSQIATGISGSESGNVLTPFQGGTFCYAQFLGLKPQAQAYHPFGVQTESSKIL